jgi:hypothetical protein
MAHGGPRSGAGRKKGSLNRLTEEAVKAAEKGGVMPLDYLLGVMRDDTQDQAIRIDAAKAAAPYVHAKLQAIQHTGADGGPIEIVSKRQRDAAVTAALSADS